MKRDVTTILDIRIDAVCYTNVLKRVSRWITDKTQTYICVAAVHLVMECQKNDALRNGVNAAGLVMPDGMPLVWLSRLFGKKRVGRVYGPTLMLALCSLAQRRGWSIFLLGGGTGQAHKLAQHLEQRFPRLLIVGCADTPRRPISAARSARFTRTINRSRAQVVFVGMGCPWQELWMIENRRFLSAPVLIGVGAAFDFLTGRAAQAPPWVQNIGLEWLFRLIHEPKRLWYRYTVMNVQFVLLILRQLLFIPPKRH